ncbi:hypothetical protein A7L55_20760 [Acinetobacter baumannii]|nr:hypothetical protein A7L55_20760 [Acinetobacter baumannii]
MQLCSPWYLGKPGPLPLLCQPDNTWGQTQVPLSMINFTVQISSITVKLLIGNVIYTENFLIIADIKYGVVSLGIQTEYIQKIC